MESQGFNLDRIVKFRDIAWSIGEVVLSSALDFIANNLNPETQETEHVDRSTQFPIQ